MGEHTFALRAGKALTYVYGARIGFPCSEKPKTSNQFDLRTQLRRLALKCLKARLSESRARTMGMHLVTLP
nr:MAG TPA: hypothetical protein [Caudoviricetes sp.]